MRKVTRNIVEAFYKGEAKSSGNTCTDGTCLWLHGNKIAEKDEFGNLHITNAGFETNVTKERLNGLLELGGLFRFQHHTFTRKILLGIFQLVNALLNFRVMDG